jgi:hypothetical protein
MSLWAVGISDNGCYQMGRYTQPPGRGMMSEMAISQQLLAIGNPSEAKLRGACCPSYPSSMVRVTSFISLISVITIA